MILIKISGWVLNVLPTAVCPSFTVEMPLSWAATNAAGMIAINIPIIYLFIALYEYWCKGNYFIWISFHPNR